MLKPKFKHFVYLLTFLVVLTISNPVDSAAKDCKFHHGMDDRYGFGATISTQTESTLKNVIKVSFMDSTPSYSVTNAEGDSSYCVVWTNYLGKKAGSHTCDYYVNGSLAHTSTKAWPFDFTGDWW